MNYYGQVDDNRLINLMSSVDVILNPHLPMEDMNNGVFPFKIMEAVASKRLVISTSLAGNDEFEEAIKGILILKLEKDIWIKSLINSYEFYINNKELIESSSDIAINFFSVGAFVNNLKEKLT